MATRMMVDTAGLRARHPHHPSRRGGRSARWRCTQPLFIIRIIVIAGIGTVSNQLRFALIGRRARLA